MNMTFLSDLTFYFYSTEFQDMTKDLSERDRYPPNSQEDRLNFRTLFNSIYDYFVPRVFPNSKLQTIQCVFFPETLRT